MKTVRGKALRVLEDLVSTTLTDEAIYIRHGVPRSTFYSWKSDPVFRAKLEEEIARFEAGLRHCRYASKRRRIEELERLYDDLPDKFPDKVFEFKGRQVLVARSNAGLKAKILGDIKEEVEGRRLEITGKRGGPVEMTFVDWMKRAQTGDADGTEEG